jgi:peptidoglycan/xylan/chitin deacetylase (PgdA/CDA1 family)
MRFFRFAVLNVSACLFAALGSFASSQTASLPTLPGNTAAPKPHGAVGNLKVLDWAGFHGAVTYTFDDSIPSQIANYPQLEATGVHMTFFLVGASDGSSPVWAQAAKDGHELGNHTEHHCHANATGCAWGPYAGSLEAEYDLCTEHIRQAYGVPAVWTTASPYGDIGFDKVAQTRFFLNRGVRNAQIAANDQSDPANLPTYVAGAGQTASTFNALIDSAHSAGNWQILLFHSLGGDGGYAPVKVEDVVASIDHAKSLGDLWIDTFVNVGAYWAGQKAVTSGVRTESGKKTLLTWTLPDHFPTGKSVRVTVTGGKLTQAGKALPWNPAGYYEVALDPGSLTISK